MKIKELIKENEGIAVEIYSNRSKYGIHTDFITCIYTSDNGQLDSIDDEKIMNLDAYSDGIYYEVMDKEEYDRTVLSNCDEYMDEEDCPILVISISEKIFRFMEEVDELKELIEDLDWRVEEEGDYLIISTENYSMEIPIKKNFKDMIERIYTEYRVYSNSKEYNEKIEEKIYELYDDLNGRF